MKTIFIPVITGFVVLISVLPAEAQRKMFPFAQRKVETQQVRELDDQAGPWLIMCASFVGDTAQMDAGMLCEELASNGFKTYTYQKKFDFSGTYEGLFNSESEKEVDVDPNGNWVPRPQRMKARTSEIEEVAVLVGDFPNVEDQRAEKALQQIKTLRIRSLTNNAHDSLIENSATNPNAIPADQNPAQSQKGLLGSAFLIANPVLPDEYFATQQIDKYILTLNRNPEFRFSLLDNPGAYSVRVATFRGDSTFGKSDFKDEEVEKKGWGFHRKNDEGSNKLIEAGLKASVLTKFLRDKGVEAWQFHDRFESYVCVGSFDWISRESAAGIEYNPDVVAVVDQFRGEMGSAFSRQNVMQPKSLPELRSKGIAFDVQPLPVAVPRANNDRRTAFGR